MSSSTSKISPDSRTIGILNTNSLHFIPISLFFLPFTFALSVGLHFFFTSSTFSPATHINTYCDSLKLLIIKTLTTNSQNLIIVKTLITISTFTFFIILPTIIGIALITYNTIRAIHGRPLTFSSTYKSLSHSYIPLLFTTVVGSIKIILISLVFTLSPIAITESIKLLGFHFDLSTISFITTAIASGGLVTTILFFIVTWGSKITTLGVLEPISGFTNQSTKFRILSLCMVCRSGFAVAALSFYANLARYIGSTTNWILISQVGLIYLQSSLMILYYVVVNAVLYMQRKETCSDEIALLAAEGGVSGEFVTVVMNEKDGEDEVPHKLAMVDGKGGFIYLMWFLFIVSVTLF